MLRERVEHDSILWGRFVRVSDGCPQMLILILKEEAGRTFFSQHDIRHYLRSTLAAFNIHACHTLEGEKRITKLSNHVILAAHATDHLLLFTMSHSVVVAAEFRLFVVRIQGL